MTGIDMKDIKPETEFINSPSGEITNGLNISPSSRPVKYKK
jgi:hypothetical protein